MTGAQCSPNGFHWAYDTHALAVGTGGALVNPGGDTWFFLTADYAFGYSLEEQTTGIREAKGGKVVGSVRHPLSTTDFRASCCRRRPRAPRSSASPMPAWTPRTRSSRRPSSASSQGGQRLAALLFTLAEVNGLGLEAAQGLSLTEGFYWNRDEASASSATAS